MKYFPDPNSGIPQEQIANAVNFTKHLNDFLEKEILVPDSKEFKEYFGFMRRGNPGDPNSRSYESSVDAFEREAWPYLLRRNGSPVIGFIWHIVYEVGPDFKSGSFIPIGYLFDHDQADFVKIEDKQARLRQIQQKPFFTGAFTYRLAEKNGILFSSIDEVISYLREFIPTLDYQKRS
ncbi:hypothetical protein KY345_06485 [Candidatus Woesearchaeota archaeon]|nr:hypothetical protein [Candidatus Woesearchaeota archaeon]